MKICLIADGQTPHAQLWIQLLAQQGHELHLITTYPISPDTLPLASLHLTPLDFSAKARAQEKEAFVGLAKPSAKTKVISRLRGSLLWKSLVKVRDGMMPMVIQKRQEQVRSLVEKIQPDVVHAMRIPFEGILAAEALQQTRYPLVVSIWGNDFTLYAANSNYIGAKTRRVMARAQGLHPDCHKDLRLAREWGFAADKPAKVMPGNGGVRADRFYPGVKNADLAAELSIPEGVSVVLNPRGLKPYIRNDVFFQSIPLVLKERPNTIFLGSAMQGKSFVESWVSRLNIANSFRALPPLSHDKMADVFRLADVTVSPSDHDGTPNTLLEAMACGVFPVAGDIESVREWIDDGMNGLLCDQSSPESLAQATLKALRQDELRASARVYNRDLICQRADCQSVLHQIEALYQDVIAYQNAHSKDVAP